MADDLNKWKAAATNESKNIMNYGSKATPSFDDALLLGKSFKQSAV